MNIIKAKNLACPLDGLPLLITEKQYQCQNGHGFDIARQNYVNLLPVQQKRSKHPGDSKEMVQARTAFLNTDTYKPIAETLNDISHSLLARSQADAAGILDAGCGEGYYLAELLGFLASSEDNRNVFSLGVDISKQAVLAATKRNKDVTWLVASNKQLPILDETIDIIICMFGFPVYDSFRKVLKPGGKIILADAGPMHLIELRNIIYPTIKPSTELNLTEAEQAGFSMIEQSTVNYTSKKLSNTQIMDLLGMTPHLYRASQEGRQAAAELDSIAVTVDVVFRTLEKVHHQ